MRPILAASVLFFALAGVRAGAQERALAQDPALDNLRHPAGTVTAAAGTLGAVRKVGEGPRRMLLIPGIGFGADVWAEFMERHRSDATMYAVTLPGFGGTAPLPMPPAGTRYADAPWIESAVAAIEALLDGERIERCTVVAHWALATQIALRVARRRPDRIDAVVLVGGVLQVCYESPPGMLDWTPEQRATFAERMADGWFRTVTRRTWDDNNFMPYDYAIHPRRALFLWRDAAAPSLPVWIRYLLEFYAADPTPALKDVRVPMLVVQPGFDDPAFLVEPGRNYMRTLCHDSWRGAREANPRLEFVMIAGSRLFVMFDKPAELDAAIASFLARLAK
jgi:pimeloyl-ACP methyl ester carboxylesterase